MDYSWDLVVSGIWSGTSFEQTVDADTLVLRKNLEDHTDHVFFPKWLWSNYLDIQKDLLPWNHVRFNWVVKWLDAAAGNHYYQVLSIYSLEKIWDPSKAELTDLISRYGYCEKDSDCVGLYGKCPLPCQIAVNTNFSWLVSNIIDNFRNAQESQCTYKCMEIKKVSCAKYKCEVQ